MKEIYYYEEISKGLLDQFEANLPDDKYRVTPLIGEISSGLRTLIVNGLEAGAFLKDYAQKVHRLHLDISLLIENTENSNFEIIIFEIKKVKSLGLSELSQLIGYCLVSKAQFGILMNVNFAVSSEFSIILDSDTDLTEIVRIVEGKKINHKLGVMVWNEKTKRIDYTNSGSIKSIPQLVKLIESELE